MVLMWVTLGFVLAVLYVTNREKIMPKNNIMGRCPDCGEAITARISEDTPHALADSVLAHVCAPAGTPFDDGAIVSDVNSMHANNMGVWVNDEL